jgi:hypothetical protein
MKKIGAEPVQGILLLEIPELSQKETAGLILNEKQRKDLAKSKHKQAEGLKIVACHSSSEYKVGDMVVVDSEQFGHIILQTSEGLEEFYMCFESQVVMKIVSLKPADLLPQN